MRTQAHAVRFHVDGIHIDADVTIPPNAVGLVVFVHGSGSSRHSPRNQSVAAELRSVSLGTVLMDLLTPEEERVDQFSGHLRFDISFLARRVGAVIAQLRGEMSLPFGLFGASTGAAAALVAAARHPGDISAVVARGGRPDLAAPVLSAVTCQTLLVVGGADHDVMELNRKAMARMTADVRLEVVPGASHLFQEPGALETVARLAADWLTRHLKREGEAV